MFCANFKNLNLYIINWSIETGLWILFYIFFYSMGFGGAFSHVRKWVWSVSMHQTGLIPMFSGAYKTYSNKVHFLFPKFIYFIFKLLPLNMHVEPIRLTWVVSSAVFFAQLLWDSQKCSEVQFKTLWQLVQGLFHSLLAEEKDFVNKSSWLFSGFRDKPIHLIRKTLRSQMFC